MGTDIYLELVLNEGSGERIRKAECDLKEARDIYRKKEKIFSRFDPESELSRLNKKLSSWQDASPDMLYLSGRALYYNKISGGLFDPRIIDILERIGYCGDFKTRNFSSVRIPPLFSSLKTGLAEDLRLSGQKIFFGRRVDFSGIAKGYITDCVAKFLKKQGWKNFLADAGGDMNISGSNSRGKKWRIAIEGISEKKLTLETSNCGIATSGISRKKWQIKGKKFHHLVNPQNPNHFSYKLRTVSVIARSAEEADGRAKTLVLMGKKKGMEFANQNKIAAVFLDYRGNIFISAEARKYIISHREINYPKNK
ncbi:MAG: hypothetical protein A3J76_05150 [Candidatus Moranbacteria bacterium RBG_13_45_13]|nr:MAG: hypothetical protein A3J76_05150 [Candidatus Moranbacteria bacterium RBG_13_45_13]